MHDIKWIRENPDAFDAAMKRRGITTPVTNQILDFDTRWRVKKTEAEEFQKDKKAGDKRIGLARSQGQDVSIDFEHMKRLGVKIEELFRQTDELEKLRDNLLATLPNLSASDVPLGASEKDNLVLRSWGEKPKIAAPKQHFDIGEALGMMDFAAAAKLSGARFVVLKDRLAKLERALAAFMLEHNVEHYGYTEVQPPYLVKDNALFGTGQLPKFGEDLFRTTNDYWLIPTAEVSLTNLVADEILPEEQLPLRYTAYTPCFRSEAGAAGKDTRGMIRQHQFHKVEMVSITTAEQSEAEHERMTACAESLLQKLGLHYRVIVLCTGDMGFSARKTYDIEVWLPGQNAYREISSCSNCGDFQARRMKARYRPAGAKDTRFVHTLNGSGLPTGRTLVALLENYQQADGSVLIPKALRPYMGGSEKIG